ncbi:hypothetical protein D9M72_655950 [compost metagenome]
MPLPLMSDFSRMVVFPSRSVTTSGADGTRSVLEPRPASMSPSVAQMIWSLPCWVTSGTKDRMRDWFTVTSSFAKMPMCPEASVTRP